MTPTEEWRPIPGFPDYEVSSTGRVLSHRGKRPHEMVGAVNQRGYRMVNLRDADGRIICRTVHRLMALAFLGDPPDGMEVRHLDGTKRNSLDNIEYATKSVNMQDQVTHGVHNMARKTHCPKGHEYNDENTYVLPSRPTARYCRACRRERSPGAPGGRGMSIARRTPPLPAEVIAQRLEVVAREYEARARYFRERAELARAATTERQVSA